MRTILVITLFLISFSSCLNKSNSISEGVVPHDCNLTYIEKNRIDWHVLAPVDINHDGNPDIDVIVNGITLSKFLFLREAHPDKDIVLDRIELYDDNRYLCGTGVYLMKQGQATK